MLVPVYDIKNCGPRHRFVANGKLVHNSDSVNLQNLASRGKYKNRIKRAIKASPGYVVIDCDSSQIEARTLAWMAGQDDLVADFAAKRDVYRIMAAAIYNCTPEEVTPLQRQVGKTVVLGCGYGVGHVKLKDYLKVNAGVDVTLDEAKSIIDTYRSKYAKIKALWTRGENALHAIANRQSFEVDVNGLCCVAELGITLPSGLHIQYPHLRRETNEEGKANWVYTSKGQPVHIYGGKCLAGDTEVLTTRGWVPIVSVTTADCVWDGVEWVNHGGLTYQGEKPTLVLNGVRMTADHEVLTMRGWQRASSCEGLHRADFRMPDGYEIRGGEWSALTLGVQVPVRGASDADCDRRGKVCEERREPILRMPSRRKEPNTFDVGAPGVLGMEIYARPMPPAFPSGVAQLRRAWHNGLRSLGRVFPSVLGGYGKRVLAGVDPRPDRQQRSLQPGELPVGRLQSTGREPARGLTGGHSDGCCADGRRPLDTGVSVEAEPVYDLRNAGPRSRFVVRGASGPFIVHNCVENLCQAVARCIVAEQMLKISKRYKVVLTVHDAVAIIAKQEEADEARAFVEECMSWVPKWATGLPLACESGVGASYGDC